MRGLWPVFWVVVFVGLVFEDEIKIAIAGDKSVAECDVKALPYPHD